MDTIIQNNHSRLKKYVWIAAIALILAALAVWALLSSRQTVYHADPVSVIIGDVTEGQFNDYIRLSGKVETGVIVQISALESGVVSIKQLEEGAMVSEGDIILTLHIPSLRQQILDSESQLAEKQNMLRDTELAMESNRLQLRQNLLAARTELNRAQRLFDRQSTLYAENLVSREEYLKAQEDMTLAKQNVNLLADRLRQDSIYRTVQIDMMRESLDNMRENFSLVRQRADNLNIRASHSGQLGSLNAELGQNISAGQLVGQINITDNYKITVNIDEHYIDRVSPGLRGKAIRQNHQMDVHVRKVYPEVTDGTFRADIIIDGDMPDNIRVGQTYPVDLQLGESTQAIMVPRGSFFQTSGGQWVYVVDNDGKTATKRSVRIGRQNPRFYEVLEGLSPGERIITSSYKSFGEADKILID